MRRALPSFLRILSKNLDDMAFKEVADRAEALYQEFMHTDGKNLSKEILKKHPEYKRGDVSKATEEIMTAFHSWLGSKVKPGNMFGAIYSLVRTKVESGISC